MSKKYKVFVAQTSDFKADADGNRISGFAENCRTEKQAKKFLLDWMLQHDRGNVIRREVDGKPVTATIALAVVALEEEVGKERGLFPADESQATWKREFLPEFDAKNGWHLAEPKSEPVKALTLEEQAEAAKHAVDAAAKEFTEKQAKFKAVQLAVKEAKKKADEDEEARKKAEAEAAKLAVVSQ